MTGEPLITVIGNLTDAPELRFTPGGAAVANFTIASTPRTFDRASNEWKDGETLFMRCSLWREAAENAAQLTKGTRVIAEGLLKSRSYEAKDGSGKRTAFELEVQELGASVKYAVVTATRSQSNGNNGGQGGFGGGQQGQQQGQGWGGQQQPAGQGWGGQQQQGAPQGQQQGYGPQNGAQQDDPWATPGVTNAGGQQGWGNGPTSEPPF